MTNSYYHMIRGHRVTPFPYRRSLRRKRNELRPPPHSINQRRRKAWTAPTRAASRRTGSAGATTASTPPRRIDAAAAQRRPPLPTAELGGGGVAQAPEVGSGRRHRRRRGWRVRRGQLGRRLLSALSPRRWLMRLCDAYVSAMLRLASSPAVVGYGAGGPYCATATHGHGAAVQLKEYDEKVLVEIYRSILARGGPLPIAGDGAGAPAAATLRLPTAV
ncbi:unnamed protein product [Miscanthus lutarioriparius]|uniref:Uncharacterized protein n=1 Tax=Miscanthus lutarioriparius TaxID=422564 RepID=A0A811NQ38_9POAL|nr:unnamed protein product [Miscanthus lutarioriparius]